MLLHQRYVPGLAILSYVLGDEESGEAVVIDPVRDIEPFIRYARDNDLHIRHIVETHVHADFVSGARELKERLGGEPTIHCSAMGGKEWLPPYADRQVRQGDRIEIGRVRIDFRHVPGHTPEHVAALVYDTSRSEDEPWLMFTGDLLFVGAVGRPDLLGEQEQKRLAHELYKSLFERIGDVPDTTEVFPAHGAGSLCGKAIASRRSSTLGFERRFSASLHKAPEEQWTRDLLGDMPMAPPYFTTMKQVNRDGPPVLGPMLPGQKRFKLKAARERIEQGALVLDTRSKEAFAAAHIPGAINIGLGKHFATWAGWVLPYDRDILVVPADAGEMPEVAVSLTRIGLDRIAGQVEGGTSAWEQAGLPIESVRPLSVHDLHRRLGEVPDRLTVLDVRTEQEWDEGHIDGAVHVHGGLLQDHFKKVPKDRPVAAICGSGYRASVAASLLQRQEYDEVYNVLGGMTAWKAAKLPTG